MAASVLNSPKAVEMSVEVVRAFVRLRGFLAAHHQLAAKLDKLERHIATHDSKIVALFEAVRSLMGTARNDYVTVSSAWKPPPLGGGGNAVRFWVASMSLEW